MKTIFLLVMMTLLLPVHILAQVPTTAPEEPTIPPIPQDKAGDVDFLYDGQGQRIARLVSGGERTYYISPGLEVTVKADGSASWKRSYGATAVREGSSTGQKLSFIYSDHLGSTSQVYDDQGNVVAQQVYYPYGTTRSTAGILSTDKEYTGQMSDINETGLYYYNARYYNPTLAKFTQADQSADGLNKYAYVGNNPVNKTDPSGNMQTPYDSGGGGGGSRKPKSPFSPIAPLDLGGSYNWSIQATSPISLEGGDLSPLENNIIFAGGSLFTAVTISPALPVLLRILPYLSLADTAYDTIGCVNKDPVSCFNISNPIPGVGIADDLVEVSEDLNNVIKRGKWLGTVAVVERSLAQTGEQLLVKSDFGEDLAKVAGGSYYPGTGIKIRDTGNYDEMTEYLHHELLHNVDLAGYKIGDNWSANAQRLIDSEIYVHQTMSQMPYISPENRIFYSNMVDWLQDLMVSGKTPNEIWTMYTGWRP